MNDFILNIDNKEILNEILHHAIDYLIESSNSTSKKSSHKLGFSNPEEFEFGVKFIANIYKEFILNTITETELIANFTHLNQELQQSVVDVIRTRKQEVEDFLVCEYNSRNNNLLISFDWDLKWIMGNNNLADYRTQIVTLSLNCRPPGSQTKDNSDIRKSKTIFMEMNRKGLDEMIRTLGECRQKLDEQNTDN